MFTFGHVGLTWGGALLLVEASRRLPPSGLQLSTASFDYRFVILGSMLPDLIDKPLGVFILRDELSSGRIFAHSLLFVLLIALAALAWRREIGSALFSVALGSAAHLVMDRMWMDPDTDMLFWPLLGLRPERQDVNGWPEQMLEQLFSDPYTYVPEVVGALIVVALLASLLMNRGLREFTRSGRMRLHLVGPAEPGLATGEERPQHLERGERPAER